MSVGLFVFLERSFFISYASAWNLRCNESGVKLTLSTADLLNATGVDDHRLLHMGEYSYDDHGCRHRGLYGTKVFYS